MLYLLPHFSFPPFPLTTFFFIFYFTTSGHSFTPSSEEAGLSHWRSCFLVCCSASLMASFRVTTWFTVPNTQMTGTMTSDLHQVIIVARSQASGHLVNMSSAKFTECQIIDNVVTMSRQENNSMNNSSSSTLCKTQGAKRLTVAATRPHSCPCGRENTWGTSCVTIKTGH